MKTADLVSAGLVALFGLLILFVVIPGWVPAHEEGGYGMGARVMPRVMATTVVVFAIAFFVSRLLGHREPGDGEGQADEPAPLDRGNWGFIGLAALFLVLVTAVFTWAGFLVAGPLTVAGFMLAMGERRPLAVLGAAILAPAAIWLFFWQLLRFPLP
jgi:hypothetical protein